jgi:hypothetical protein
MSLCIDARLGCRFGWNSLYIVTYARCIYTINFSDGGRVDARNI